MRARSGTGSRLLLGLAGTVDYEVSWSTQVIEELAGEFGVGREDADAELAVQDERDVIASILGFMAHDNGGERHATTADLLIRIAQRLEHRVTIGGTGVRAALALAALGYRSRVHLVSIDDTVRRLLPPTVEYISSAVQDTSEPHLIIQYPADVEVRLRDGAIRSRHPNRIIYAHDVAAQELILHDDIEEIIAASDTFLVCGFNVIRDIAILEDRLERVIRGIAAMPAGGCVFVEDAGFHVPEFRRIVRERLGPVVSVYSMNDDEMQELVGAQIDLDDADALIAAVEHLLAMVPARNVVVHSRSWALVAGHDAADLVQDLDNGVVLASTRYRVGDALRAEDVAQTRCLPRNAAGLEVAARVERAFGGRVRAVATPDSRVSAPTTIGLGDTFAAGFLLRRARG